MLPAKFSQTDSGPGAISSFKQQLGAALQTVKVTAIHQLSRGN